MAILHNKRKETQDSRRINKRTELAIFVSSTTGNKMIDMIVWSSTLRVIEEGKVHTSPGVSVTLEFSQPEVSSILKICTKVPYQEIRRCQDAM
jgi:hypothetical protein